MDNDTIIYLNVGGQPFATRASTLTNGSPYFRALLTGGYNDSYTVDNPLFLDFDPVAFTAVMRYLRHGDTNFAKSDLTCIQDIFDFLQIDVRKAVENYEYNEIVQSLYDELDISDLRSIFIEWGGAVKYFTISKNEPADLYDSENEEFSKTLVEDLIKLIKRDYPSRFIFETRDLGLAPPRNQIEYYYSILPMVVAVDKTVRFISKTYTNWEHFYQRAPLMIPKPRHLNNQPIAQVSIVLTYINKSSANRKERLQLFDPVVHKSKYWTAANMDELEQRLIDVKQDFFKKIDELKN